MGLLHSHKGSFYPAAIGEPLHWLPHVHFAHINRDLHVGRVDGASQPEPHILHKIHSHLALSR